MRIAENDSLFKFNYTPHHYRPILQHFMLIEYCKTETLSQKIPLLYCKFSSIFLYSVVILCCFVVVVSKYYTMKVHYVDYLMC